MLDWFKRIAVPRDQLAETLTEAKVERLVDRFAAHPGASTPAERRPVLVPTPAADDAAKPGSEDEPAPTALVERAPSPTAADAEAPPVLADMPAPADEDVAPASDGAPVAAVSEQVPAPVALAETETSPVADAESALAEDLPAPTVLAETRVPPVLAETRVPPVFGDTRVIVVASQKGGSGKTTLAAHLAVRAGMVGQGPAVLVDTDPQGSLTEWWHARADESLALSRIKLSELVGHLAELRRQGASLVIIDTPPALTTSIEQVIAVADLVLVPARPSPHDLRAVGATVDMIRKAGKPFLFVVNGAAPRANITAEAVAALSEHGQVAPVILYQRTDYAASMIDGRTVMEAAPSSRSTQEISDLWNYVQPRINLRAAA